MCWFAVEWLAFTCTNLFWFVNDLQWLENNLKLFTYKGILSIWIKVRLSYRFNFDNCNKRYYTFSNSWKKFFCQITKFLHKTNLMNCPILSPCEYIFPIKLVNRECLSWIIKFYINFKRCPAIIWLLHE